MSPNKRIRVDLTRILSLYKLFICKAPVLTYDWCEISRNAPSVKNKSEIKFAIERKFVRIKIPYKAVSHIQPIIINAAEGEYDSPALISHDKCAKLAKLRAYELIVDNVNPVVSVIVSTIDGIYVKRPIAKNPAIIRLTKLPSDKKSHKNPATMARVASRLSNETNLNKA